MVDHPELILHDRLHASRTILTHPLNTTFLDKL